MKAGSLFINGTWQSGHGPILNSYNPATGESVWEGTSAGAQDLSKAIDAAKSAQRQWANSSLDTRLTFLQAFKRTLSAERRKLSETISKENGKPLWEALSEVDAMIGKIDISIQAYAERCSDMQLETSEKKMIAQHRPHGVIAVFGPFNFPGHLPNGHIIPALIAGNTVIFKPSELTPLVAEVTVQLWEQAGLPKGVLNLLQGGSKTGKLIAEDRGIDGLFLTGSWQTGHFLTQLFSNRPGKILALELGGNNPLIVSEGIDPKVSAYLTLQSAYLTSGQRCSCARRLIVPYGNPGDIFIEELSKMIQNLSVGPYTDTPEPFMGPVISIQAANKLLVTQQQLIDQGGQCLVEMHRTEPHSSFLFPGLIDVTSVSERKDEEHFGPLLQLVRVNDFEEALQEASNTEFGLVAGLISSSEVEFNLFKDHIKAGIVCWNTPTTNASSRLPFGGVGKSGNFRPSAYYAADYCAYPSTYTYGKSLQLPEKLFPGINIHV